MDSSNQDQSALHHLSRTFNDKSDEENLEENGRGTYANENSNKTDVMIVDDCALHMSQLQKAREQNLREQQERLALVEMQQDEQLKELGLYEEGMTREQKRELLEVVATSRETAREEENRRQRTKDWENKILYISDDSRQNSEQHLKYSDGGGDHLYNPSATYRRESNNNHGRQHVESPVLKNQGTSSPSDDDTKSLCSQELFQTQTSCDEMDSSYCQEENHTQKTIGETPVKEQSKYFKSLTIHHIKCDSSLCEKMVNEMQCSNSHASEEVDNQECFSVWPSPDSPLSVSLCQRFIPDISEKVPFFCPHGMQPREYTCKILESINHYHKKLLKLQRTSLKLCHWGEPVSIGRHHPNSLDVVRRGVPNKQVAENDNALKLRKVVTEQCIETTIDDDSYSLPDLEEWTSDKGPLYQPDDRCTKHNVSPNEGCDQQEFVPLNSVQTFSVHETDNQNFPFSVNKQDVLMECENSDISSINIDFCDKSSLQDVLNLQNHTLQNDLMLSCNKNGEFNSDDMERTKEISTSIETGNNVTSQTGKVHPCSSLNYIQESEQRHLLSESEISKQVNHVISSTNFQNHGSETLSSIIHEDAEITESEIQIECLPSKRDKRNYARAPKQITKVRKIMEEEKQRKRKFEEELKLQDSSEKGIILPPIKRKL